MGMGKGEHMARGCDAFQEHGVSPMGLAQSPGEGDATLRGVGQQGTSRAGDAKECGDRDTEERPTLGGRPSHPTWSRM